MTKLNQCYGIVLEENVEYAHCFTYGLYNKKNHKATSHADCTKCCWCGERTMYDIQKLLDINWEKK